MKKERNYLVKTIIFMVSIIILCLAFGESKLEIAALGIFSYWCTYLLAYKITYEVYKKVKLIIKKVKPIIKKVKSIIEKVESKKETKTTEESNNGGQTGDA